MTADGRKTSGGTFRLEAAGHQTVKLPLPLKIPESRFGTYLRISMKDGSGKEIAFEQMELEAGGWGLENPPA